MKTLFELLREETPGNIRTQLLSKINDIINKLFSSGQKVGTLSLITNVFSPIALPIGAMLNVHATQILEQALIRFRRDGCEDLYVILSTLGGDIHFPELFIGKARGLGFERINIIIPSIAMSAGTLLAMLSDRIIGFSFASIGPVDPQLIVQTPQGLRVISAIAYKRLIEETLPRLAYEKKLGVDGLSRLYIAQDMYLYQESLRSLDYVKKVLNNNVKLKLDENKFEELLSTFLTDVETHSKPLGLKVLKELGFDVIFLDSNDEYKELAELIAEYYSRVEHAFVFEPSKGARILLIGAPFGEIIQEAIVQVVKPPPHRVGPPSQQQKKEESTKNIQILGSQ